MGAKTSIDKHNSMLEDVLEMSPAYFDKIRFESKISPDITQHLKVAHFVNYNSLHRYGSLAKTRENLKM